MRHHPIPLTLIAAGALAMLGSPALAAVSAEEAKQLGASLTAFGAEKAGNKDGSIPPYTGGLTSAVKTGRAGLPPKLFADEKPLLQIKADNVDQHADKLTDGFKYLLKNYPGFRIDVYPSHRTHAEPKFFDEQCANNAVSAKVVNEAIEGGKGGCVFPIPKSGIEAIFNTMWNWRGADREFTGETWFVSSAGKRSLITSNVVSESFPYAYQDKKDTWDGRMRGLAMVEVTAPAYSAGEKTLVWGPGDPIHVETQGWTFLTGQRRLRKIPNVQYDVPFTYTNGNTNWDDSYGFNGATDRYDWKLVGKKEIYVPYNNNNMTHVEDLDQLMGPQYVNPDHVRFELHRVWVVDASLRQGARHTVPKRRLYIDEDSWNIITTDQWDAKGQFWKNISLLTWVYPEVPTQVVASHMIYNVQSKAYVLQNTVNRAPGGVTFKARPVEFYSPQTLERSGVR
ncbi:MAG TPA: DUF1329 domain-containing protein [Ideonella sp.]|nr:DUF1329 domain-containing protein [Ideonella sp.]